MALVAARKIEDFIVAVIWGIDQKELIDALKTVCKR
jgi:hypothetical protein